QITPLAPLRIPGVGQILEGRVAVHLRTAPVGPVEVAGDGAAGQHSSDEGHAQNQQQGDSWNHLQDSHRLTCGQQASSHWASLRRAFGGREYPSSVLQPYRVPQPSTRIASLRECS